MGQGILAAQLGRFEEVAEEAEGRSARNGFNLNQAKNAKKRRIFSFFLIFAFT